jgi:hypothetical protein
MDLTFSHVYYIWKSLKPHVGPDLAYRAYGEVWKALTLAGMHQSMAALGLEEIADIPTLGRVLEHLSAGVPQIYQTVENSPDRHVGRIHWCPNPFYAPRDRAYHHHEYYRNAEVPLYESAVLQPLVEEARKLGLRDEVEWALPEGRCRDGCASFCQVLVWRKGSPRPAPASLASAERRYLEDEMGAEEPIMYVLKQLGQKPEEFGATQLATCITIDASAYDGMARWLGQDSSLGAYQRLWLTYPRLWVKEARLKLEIGRVESLAQLGQIVAFCERKRLVPYRLVSSGEDQAHLVGEDDPFLDVAVEALHKEPGDSYFGAVAAVDEAFVNEILLETGMAEKVRIRTARHLVLGHNRNEIILERK